jgi:adenylate cyclase
LIDTHQRVNVWAKTYEYALSTDDWFKMEDEIVGRIVATLADSYGVILRALSQDTGPQGIRDNTAYDAILRFHHAIAVLEPEALSQALDALEYALQQHPEHVTLLTMLADIHAQAFQLGMSEESSLDKTASLVRRALALNLNHPHAHWVMGYLHFLRGEADACARECEASLVLNPNHANLVGATGWALTMVGKTERGLSLVQKAMHLNPHYPRWYHLTMFLPHYRKANYEAALEEALRINTPGFFIDPLCRAAVLGQLGRRADANAALQELLSLVPDFPTTGREQLRRIVFSENHVEMLWEGLCKAGLVEVLSYGQ